MRHAGVLRHRTYTPNEIEAYAWHIPFVLGGVFGLVAVYLRRFLSETPVFQELLQQRALAQELPVKTVIREHRRACLLAAGLTWPLSTSIVVVILMTPTILQSMHGIPATTVLEANCLATLALTLGGIGFGWLAGATSFGYLVRSFGGQHIRTCFKA